MSTRTLRTTLLALPLVLLCGPSEAQRTAPDRGEKYALLVGVREYDPAELRGLKFSEADIDGLAEVLRRAGYRPENIKTMTQTLGAARTRFLPTGVNIRRELGLLLKPLEPADSVLVALAGHGVQFRDVDESYFCPADARLADRSSLIPLSEVHRTLEGCAAGFKLLLVDACRNDPLTAVSRDAGRPVVDLPSLSRPIVRRPPGGVAAFFSCSPGEIAFENPGLNHGVFFHFVIKALDGEADTDGDSTVDVEELSSFTKKRVFQFVDATYGREQTPELVNRTRGSVSIIELRRTLTNSLGMTLVLIPAGEFPMGSPGSDPDAYDEEKPQHRVRITRPFYLGIHEVTQREYWEVTRQNPSHFSATGDGKDRVPGNATGQYPVENVSWLDAVKYCNALSAKEGLAPYYEIAGETVRNRGGTGYRLPTEAEWEYACRAGSTTKYSFGDDATELGQHAWILEDFDKRATHPVGQKKPNRFGLYDMHGNVWEWCWDWFDAQYYSQSPAADPAGSLQASARVVRGVSWGLPRQSRSAYRFRLIPGYLNAFLGFRVARVQSGQ